MKKKKILVTGGAGFIGSNFIRLEFKKNPSYRIINLDKLTYSGNLDNTNDFRKNSNYKFIKADIADKKNIANVVDKERPDCIINFAAESHVDNSILNPIPFMKTNVLGTHILLDITKYYKINKFIQISTDEVYGTIKKGKFKESDSLRPNSPYSASKASADLIVRSYIKTYNFPAIIIRPSNNFGPYQNTEKFIPLFITNFLQNKKAPLYGKGNNIREWIYVLDACDAIDKILHEGNMGEIYNIGSGQERKNLEVAEFLQKNIREGKNLIKFIKDRKGHDFRYSLDSSKIRKLGWRPKYKFEESLLKTIEWYKNNKWWWKKSNL